MIIAVCDPKGIAIEAIKTILYHDKGLSDRISRIYEFWNMEQLLDASRDSSFDCIVFPNYCNSHNSVVCSLSCGYKLKSCETDTAPGFGRGYALRAHGGASSRTPRPCTKGHGNRKPLHISKYFYETKI